MGRPERCRGEGGGGQRLQKQLILPLINLLGWVDKQCEERSFIFFGEALGRFVENEKLVKIRLEIFGLLLD